MPQSLQETCIVTKVKLKPDAKIAFSDWQAKLNATIAGFPGFVSLEILSPSNSVVEWIIVQRFHTTEHLSKWQTSKERIDLIAQLKSLLADHGSAIQDVQEQASNVRGGVTEVFVTEIDPNKDVAYRNWLAKIHQVEAKFPGFRGMYVQSPKQSHGKNWITLLQFDTLENLDRWLISSERQEVLNEAKSMITSLESHRVISPYAGWFSSISESGAEAPPVWKQTMIVLLVLFPIVMLELKFLSPWTANWNRSLGTFLGNAISVTLISWPTVPIAIYFLRWWLSPQPETRKRDSLIGTAVVLVLYIIEIAVFWNLL